MMRFLDKIQIESKRVRRAVELLLLAIGVVYYASIYIMHTFSPLTGMLPMLLGAFTIPLLLALAVVHWAGRLNAFMVLAALSLTGIPFCIVMHNFLEGLARRTTDTAILHQVLELLHGAFFFGALFVCPLGLVVGIIGAIVGLMHSTNGPENDI